MWEVFNMGCGFCCVVPPEHADRTVSLLAQRHPGTAVIGEVTDADGVVELPRAGLCGRAGGFEAV
jgi:phosphoribosylaminoimidazole (AIR) synthetase